MHENISFLADYFYKLLKAFCWENASQMCCDPKQLFPGVLKSTALQLGEPRAYSLVKTFDFQVFSSECLTLLNSD